MRIGIFSDLHIEGPQDFLYTRLIECLDTFTSAHDRVVLAGDIFEILVGGDEHFKEQYTAFLGVIRNLCAHGVQIDYLEGNHDFHLEKFFHGIPIHVDHGPLLLNFGAKRLWIEHGDEVDQTDTKYLLWRKATRSLPSKIIIQALPAQAILRIHEKIARTESEKQRDLPENWDPGRLHALRWMYRHYAERKFAEGIDWVVMGHCHDFDDWKTEVNSRECQYFNMGYPRVHGMYIEASGSMTDENLTLQRKPL